MTLGSQVKSTFDAVEYSRAPETDIADQVSNGNDPHYKDAHTNSLELNNMKNGKNVAAQGDIEARVPERSGCCNRSEACVKKCALYSCFSGLAVLIITVICVFLMRPYVESKILQNLPIREGTPVYAGWLEPPVTPVVQFRIFNITNKESFLAGRGKPNFVEIGPYVYLQDMKKEEVSFAKDEPSVTFKVAKRYYFSPELSCTTCKESDIITVPNIPMFGAFEKLAKESSTVKNMFVGLIKSYDFAIDTKPFLTLPIHDFLWGYPSILASLARNEKMQCSSLKSKGGDGWDDFEEEGNPCDLEPNNLQKFGLFFGRNGTAMDIRTVDTGVQKLEDKGLMVAWHGKRELNYWTKPECNKLTGRDPGGIPMDLQKNEPIELFIGQLCRTVKFRYVSEGKVGEFTTYRYTPMEDSFDSPSDNPDNECYCLNKPCNPSGLHDIRGCQQYSPIFMSWPHFLYGDSDLRRKVTGIHPNQTQHSFILDISPKYGLTLRALARLQMNVILRKNNGFGFFDRIQDDQLVYPFMWLEDGVLGPSETVTKNVRFLLNLPSQVQAMVGIIGLIISLVLLIPEIVVWSRTCCRCGGKKV